MRSWKVFALSALVLAVLAGVVFAEISRPPVSPMPMTSINVVCLYKNFPVAADVSVIQIDADGNTIHGTGIGISTTTGFASFRVRQGLDYRVSANKYVILATAYQDLKNVVSAAVVALNLKSATDAVEERPVLSK